MTFWSYIFLLPLSEQKNSDMVEILDKINDLFVEVLTLSSDKPELAKKYIAVLLNSQSTDQEIATAENELMKIAKIKGLPFVIGDQLTYERAFIAKELRRGNITSIERLDFLLLRLAPFHLLMAKVGRDFKIFLPSLTNILDKGTLAYIRARLSRHEITNDGDKIKKGN